jgi:hypothetical protein
MGQFRKFGSRQKTKQRLRNLTKVSLSKSVKLTGYSHLLQNQTRTTSLSIDSESPIIRISSEVGLEFFMKALSRAIRTWFSIEVRFLRRLPI